MAHSVSTAGGAHPFAVVEAEVFWSQASGFGFWKRRKEIAQRGEEIDVGAHIGAIGVTDGILIQDEELVEMVHPFECGPGVGDKCGPFASSSFAAQGSLCCRFDKIPEECRFSRSGDSGDACDGTNGDVSIDSFQVVQGGVAHLDRKSVV